MLRLFMDILVDSMYEALALFPYLYLTYLLMEYLEQRLSRQSMIYIRKSKQYGPIAGGLLGVIPQCGFSVSAANLYATGLISLGSMLAVFLSTSDEMVPVLLSSGIGGGIIIKILIVKVIYAIVAGLLIDKFLPESFIKHKKEPNISAFCAQEKCKCENKKENIYKSAFNHTEKITIFIFVFALLVNTAFSFGGYDNVKNALTGMPVLGGLIAGLVGLIPSCYPSVLLSQLYADSAISLSTMMTGLLSNSGLGLLILYRVNKNTNEVGRIIALIYLISIVLGAITSIIF